MSPVDMETKRKLREMNAGDLLAALETQDESLSMGLAFEERVRLLVDDAYSAFTHSKITGLLWRAGLRYPNANLRRVDLTWMDGEQGQMGEDDWHDQSRRLLGMYSSDHNDAFLTWFHSGEHPVAITLPGVPWAKEYTIYWHSAGENELPKGPLEPGAPLVVPGRCTIVMRAEVPTSGAELQELEAFAQYSVDVEPSTKIFG